MRLMMCNEKQEQLSVVNSIFMLAIISTLKETDAESSLTQNCL